MSLLIWKLNCAVFVPSWMKSQWSSRRRRRAACPLHRPNSAQVRTTASTASAWTSPSASAPQWPTSHGRPHRTASLHLCPWCDTRLLPAHPALGTIGACRQQTAPRRRLPPSRVSCRCLRRRPPPQPPKTPPTSSTVASPWSLKGVFRKGINLSKHARYLHISLSWCFKRGILINDVDSCLRTVFSYQLDKEKIEFSSN
jgi:hypothetical protein